MPVSFERLVIGEKYERPYLAEIWGYSGFEAIAKGVVTPRNTPFVILFITKETDGSQTGYQNSLEDGVLDIEGENSHIADGRIVNAESNSDQIHLFYREERRAPFVYWGQVYLTEYTLLTDRPSHFRFVTGLVARDIDSALVAEALAHGTSLEEYIPDPEGRRKVIQSIAYERSRRNRRRAIEIHGNSCVVCGFSFDAFYGADLARGFIEVHHTKSVAEMVGQPVDVDTDLMPVCSNCHSMLHRRGNTIVSISELSARVIKAPVT